MKYSISGNKIIVSQPDDFNPQHILDCGQVFRFSKIGEDVFEVRVGDYQATITKIKDTYEILSGNPQFFVKYFDLDTDYSKIKRKLRKHGIVSVAITAGTGLRILNAPFLETAVSFIISANNNIKRIQLILNRLCEKAGQEKGGFFTFPTLEKLLQLDQEFWKRIGAGYRANYLPGAIQELAKLDKDSFKDLTTKEARNKLIALPGIGPKVADCILLFGLQRFDVFPVDVWIEKLYYKHFGKEVLPRTKIAEKLVEIFGDLSGYAQQYLFNYRQALSNYGDNLMDLL